MRHIELVELSLFVKCSLLRLKRSLLRYEESNLIAHPINSDVEDIGAVFVLHPHIELLHQQEPNEFDIILVRCPHDGGVPISRGLVHFRPISEKKLHDLVMAETGSPAESSGLAAVKSGFGDCLVCCDYLEHVFQLIANNSIVELLFRNGSC